MPILLLLRQNKVKICNIAAKYDCLYIAGEQNGDILKINKKEKVRTGQAHGEKT